MFDFNSWLASGGGLGNRRREQERMAQIAMQKKLQDAQLANTQAATRSRDLANTQAARQMARGPQNTFKTITGQDGQSYQVEVNAQGQIVGQPTVVGGMGSKPFQMNPAQQKLAPFLDPSLDPSQATTKDWVEARQRLDSGQGPKPMTEYQQRQVERWNKEDALKASEANKSNQAALEEQQAAEDFAAETLQLVNQMLDPQGLGKGLNSSVGTFQGSEWVPSLREDTVNFDNAHDTLVSRLTKENLGIMKGVLSDTDIRILQDIGAGRLKRRGGEAAYREELERIRDKMMAASGTTSSLPAGVTEADIQETMRANNMTRAEVLEAIGVR